MSAAALHARMGATAPTWYAHYPVVVKLKLSRLLGMSAAVCWALLATVVKRILTTAWMLSVRTVAPASMA